MRTHRHFAMLLPLTLMTAACGSAEKRAEAPTAPPPPPPLPTATVAAPARVGHAMDRMTFNKLALRLNLPVYWIADANTNGEIDPDETATLLFYPTSKTAKWIDGGKFTQAFEDAYLKIVAANVPADAPTTAALSPEEKERRTLVLQELDQARATLVRSDLTALRPDDKAFVKHVLAASDLVDKLYAAQIGAVALEGRVPADDPASASLFRRNWGPRCLEPLTEKNPACSAIPGAPKPICDAYPAVLQDEKERATFCEKLEKMANAKALLDPFVVVRSRPEAGAALEPVPFSVAYKSLMQPIADELRLAESSLKDPKEDALRAYLRAASASFLTNDWTPADEAWAKMNATNSSWYLRIAADETYWDPCAHKAGFHVTFARINRDSLAWQDKLVPVEQAMEQALAARIGAPYAARKVTFHLPDFIDIVINAGDDRKESGATIGQSLPNWGPVANEGRGRTVAMSNLYSDPDSLQSRKDGAESLLSKETMAAFAASPTPGLLATILHEATHNLGPAHEYKYKGKTDSQWFGGGLSSMLEELKAQTGGYYFIDFLVKKGIIDEGLAKQTYLDNIVWSFGHISRGMYTEQGGRKAYGQLAAIQLGFLLEAGALTWEPALMAANGKDTGALVLHFDKVPAAIDNLMKIVGAIKATGDRAGAEALAKKYVDGSIVPQKVITERWLRNPRPNFVYSVRM